MNQKLKSTESDLFIIITIYIERETNLNKSVDFFPNPYLSTLFCKIESSAFICKIVL